MDKETSKNNPERLPSGPGRTPSFDGPNAHVKAAGADLDAYLILPPEPLALVIFAHEGTSHPRAPRDLRVAEALREASFGSLLLDLLTPIEAQDAHNARDVTLLTDRLKAAVKWARHELPGVPRCFFGAGTGAAAALWAAAQLGSDVKAVICRGGRPDLAMPRLPAVTAPTLLIVGEQDLDTLEPNRLAAAQIPDVHLLSVPRATHLFEEAGAPEAVAEAAVGHLRKYLLLSA